MITSIPPEYNYHTSIVTEVLTSHVIYGVVKVLMVWLLDLELSVQSVSILTIVVSSNHTHGEGYLIQHHVIKFVNDLQQVGGFLRFPPPIKLTATI